MHIKEKCKQIRLKLLMSQEDFAKVLGVAFSTVNRWENGHIKPSYKAQRALQELCKKHKIDFFD